MEPSPGKPSRPPAPRDGAKVRRPTLIAELEAASRLRLTLLIAPAGSGKSVLLQQWQDQRSRDSGSIVRLEADTADADEEPFARRLLNRLREAGLGLDEANAKQRRIGDRPTSPIDTLFTLLVKLTAGVTIVIDQSHLFAGGSTPALIDRLLQLPTPELTWILAGQRSDLFETSAHLLDGQLTVLGPDNLRFDQATIQRLARKTCVGGISKVDAAAIYTATEGWAAGVLFGLVGANESGHFDADLSARLHGARVDIAMYFETAVWRHLDAPLRDFLTETAVVDTMTAELCNALLGMNDAQTVLESLYRSQTFLVALDNYDNGFRYHRLFRQFLQRRLRADPARLASLDLRASRWYEDRQDHVMALQHAFAGADVARQRELLRQCAGALRNDGDFDVLLAYWNRVSGTDAVADEAITGPAVFGLILLQRFGEARATLRLFGPDGPGHATMLPNRLLLLQRMLALLSHSDDVGSDALLSTAQRAGLDAFESGWALILNAYAQMQRGQFDAAWRMSMRAHDSLQRVSVLGHGYANITALLAERAQCDFRFGRERCEALFRSVRNGAKNAAWVNACIAMAHLRYEESRLVESEALLTEVTPLLGMGATIEHVMTVYDTLSRIHAVHERHTEATRLLHHLQSMLEEVAHPHFLAQVCGERIRQYLARHDLRRAREVAAEFNLKALAQAGEWSAARPYNEAWERFGHAYAQILTYSGHTEEAIRIFTTLRQSAMGARYTYRVMMLEAALAGCHWEAGNRDEAFAALNRGLGYCQSFGGYPRTALDDVPRLGLVFAAATEQDELKQSGPSKPEAGAESPMNRRARAGRSLQAPQPAFPIEPLTDSELRTLRMLGKGLSNLEISTQTRTAVSTVKWHVKNLFSKLDVGSRSGAIARARELRLID